MNTPLPENFCVAFGFCVVCGAPAPTALWDSLCLGSQSQLQLLKIDPMAEGYTSSCLFRSALQLPGKRQLKGFAINIPNAPLSFWCFFKVTSVMFPAKLRQRTHLPKKPKGVYEIIDRNQLLLEHGGSRQHDQTQCVRIQIEREISGAVLSPNKCFRNE